MDNAEPEISADKIIEKSKQWTLEGDSTLLQWMDKISKNLEERVTKTSSALNDLSTKLDRTSVALNNVTNNLAALQYSQFVENRVHDDDETLANIAEVPNPVTDVTDKAPDQNIYSFLKKNLEMMNSCHEAFSISYEDSDEDEPAVNVVYRSKNPYEARSLPHIYGSNLWKEKWHIGLCDSDNDFSGDEESEQFSESSSSAEDDSYESTAPTMSEWDSTAWGLNTNHLVERKEIHTPSNDGESSCQGENYSHSDSSTPRTQTIIQPVADQRYYQHIPRREENLFDNIFNDSEQQAVAPQVVAPAPKKVAQDIFIPNEPPPDEPTVESDNNRRVGARKPLNLFDDDEFSSFMNQIVQTANKKNVKGDTLPEEKVEPPKKAVVPNLFDDLEDIYTPSISEPAVVKNVEVSPNLEEDIFSPPPLPALNAKTKIRNLFDDDDDDDDFESMFAAKPSGSNKFTQKTKNLFEDDLGVDVIPEKQTISQAPLVKEATVREVPLVRKGLFDDDEGDLKKEEERFATKPVKKDLFDDVFSKEDKIADSGLKSDIFSDVEQAEISKKGDGNEKKEKILTNVVNEEEPSNSAAVSMIKTDLFADVFQDEPPDDLFATSFDKKKTKVADIFADDFADDFEEFIPKVAKSGPPNLTEDKQEIPPDDILHNSAVGDAKPVTDSKLPGVAPKPKIPVINEGIRPTPEKESARVETVEVEKKPTGNILRSQSEHFESGAKKDSDQIPANIAEDKNLFTTLKTDIFLDAEKQTTTIPKYTSLFQDEPPPDDEDPTVNLFEETQSSYVEPSKYSEDEDLNVSPPTVVPYSSINLFADVPPDDDFTIAPPVETKRIHSIFYDDFNETIEASREMRAPSTYIFNDEPPPDDDLPSRKAVFEEQSKVVEEKKDKAKVGKLKTDLQINVGALLPTAKIPSFKKSDGILESASESIRTSPKDNENKIATTKPPEKRDLPENILPNLNRDRAKVQVKRRPSTRKGRQESYRKSMIEDEIIAAKQEQDEDEQRKEEGVKTATTDSVEDFGTYNVKKLNADVSTFSESLSREEFKTITSVKQIPEPEIFVKSEDSKIESTTEKRSSTETPTNKLSSLFTDSEKDTGNIGRNLRSKPKPPADSKISNVFDSLFDSDGVDENPFGSPTKQSIPPKATTQESSQPTKKSKVVFKSAASTPLFDESDEDEKISGISVKSSTKPSSLFGESDKDEKERSTIGKSFKVSAGPIKPSSRGSSLFGELDEDEKKQPAIVTIPESTIPGSKPLREPVKSFLMPSSIFGESDEDEKKELSKEPAKALPKSSSIFDESDEDKKKQSVMIPKFKEPALKPSEEPIKKELSKEPAKAFPKSSSIFEELDEDKKKQSVMMPKFKEPAFKPSEEPIKSSVKPSSLFGESDEDENKAIMTSSKKPAFKPAEEPIKSSPRPSSLFGESDDGSDDLFKASKPPNKPAPQKTVEKKPKPKPVSQPTKPPSSLFSSDEESGHDGDIFGKPKMKVAPKKIESAKAKPSSSLFADLSDDDDDDLFGTGKKKPSGVEKSKSKTTSNTSEPTKKSALISNNPLSDLLGP